MRLDVVRATIISVFRKSKGSGAGDQAVVVSGQLQQGHRGMDLVGFDDGL